jgi:dolichyl-phosphate-mannose--protein O-mannosyl transferase
VYAIAGTPTYAIAAYAITGVICIRHRRYAHVRHHRIRHHRRHLHTLSVYAIAGTPTYAIAGTLYLFISTPAYIVAAYARSIIYPFINGRVRHRRTKYVITIATNTNK